MSEFKQVLVPELNLGQFRSILRNKFLVDANANLCNPDGARGGELLGEEQLLAYWLLEAHAGWLFIYSFGTSDGPQVPDVISTDPPFRPPALSPLFPPNSRIAASFLCGTPARIADAVWGESGGQWGHTRTKIAGHALRT